MIITHKQRLENSDQTFFNKRTRTQGDIEWSETSENSFSQTWFVFRFSLGFACLRFFKFCDPMPEKTVEIGGKWKIPRIYFSSLLPKNSDSSSFLASNKSSISSSFLYPSPSREFIHLDQSQTVSERRIKWSIHVTKKSRWRENWQFLSGSSSA